MPKLFKSKAVNQIAAQRRGLETVQGGGVKRAEDQLRVLDDLVNTSASMKDSQAEAVAESTHNSWSDREAHEVSWKKYFALALYINSCHAD